MARGAGFAPVEFGLDGGFVQRDARRSAIENAANGRAVAFAVGGEDEVLSDAVSAHGWVPCLGALVFIFVFVCCARQGNGGGNCAVGNTQGEGEPKQRQFGVAFVEIAGAGHRCGADEGGDAGN